MDALHPDSPAPGLSADHTAIADSSPEENTSAVLELARRQYELTVLTALSVVAARSPEVADVLDHVEVSLRKAIAPDDDDVIQP